MEEYRDDADHCNGWFVYLKKEYQCHSKEDMIDEETRGADMGEPFHALLCLLRMVHDIFFNNMEQDKAPEHDEEDAVLEDVAALQNPWEHGKKDVRDKDA